MIARLWQGRVPVERADAYVGFLRARAIPDNLGVQLLHRERRVASKGAPTGI